MILTRENIGSVDIDLLIDQKIKNGRSNELLVIVPTNRKARSLKKEFISLSPNCAAHGLNIETLGTISAKLLIELKPFKKLSEAAATVFIKQCASEIKLKYFSVYKEEIPFGTLDRIKNVISEYKWHGITPELLRREAEGLEKSERNKALDIADIYERFIQRCAGLSAFESGDIYRELNNFSETEFISIFQRLYAPVDFIIINGFSEFSNSEIEIVRKISSAGKAKTFIGLDYDLNNDQLFSHLDKCYVKLEGIGFKRIKDDSAKKPDEFTAAVRNNLFSLRNLPKKIGLPGKLFKIESSDRENEVEMIAGEIKTLILKHEVEPHKISVVFNLIGNYSSIVKDVFEKNGIPLNLTDRTPLDNSNPVTALINFLEIAENNFYFKNIFRALNSRFIDLPEIDVSNLYRISSELNIVAGKQNWIDSLTDSISNISHTGDDDTEPDQKRQNLLKALTDIEKIIGLLKPFDEKLTIVEFDKLLKDLTVSAKLPQKLLGIEIDQEKNVRAFTEFIETITEIFLLLKKESGEDKKFPLGYFMDQMRTACGWARFNVKEKSDYGVQVTNLEEIRGLRFDYLFIGGLCDGDLPTRYSPEIFFSGSFKKKASLHQLEERYMFYQSLCCWNERLYLSYPKTEGGRETVVSTFLKDFENVFVLAERKEKDYNDRIFSKEELQIFAGKAGVDSLSEAAKNNFDFDLQKISLSLRIEKIRSVDPFADSPYTGNVLSTDGFETSGGNSDELKKKLEQYSSRQYSISQLETYAKCPFKFFMEKVLGIETIEEPTEDIEAIEMGRLLHSILFEFYSSLRDRKLKLAGCNATTFSQAEDLIFKIAEEQIKTTAFKSPLTFYEKEKILGLNSDKKESILYRFLEAEKEYDDDFLPFFFEVSFGRLKESEADKLLSDPEPVRVGDVKLRGKIDRIEVNEKIKSFNVVDYKLSGAKPTFDELKNGVSLQLPVYLFAASELLSKKFNGKYSPNEMFIYSLKYAVDDFGKDKVSLSRRKDEEIRSVNQLIDKTIEHIKNYIAQISEGRFGLSPHENREKIVCRYCHFRTVCRIDEAN